jgi:hypothetical protein
MAYNNRNASSATRARSAAPGAADDSWKAQGFLNFFLEMDDGSKAKFGAIALYDNNANQAAVREWLEGDATAISRLLANLSVTYVPNERKEGVKPKLV